jgi:Putative Ig domain
VRFTRVVLLVAAFAALFAGAASALDFNDEGDNAPIGEVGKLYHFEMPSHGGCDTQPYKYVVESGHLPPGLILGNLPHVNLSGLVDGIPTEPGVYKAWIALKDICGNSAELLFTFTIWERRWGIATQSLKPGAVGSPYSTQLEVQGVPSTTKWELESGTLPAGLTLSGEGVLSGTPTAGGSATFTLKATGNAKDFSGTRVDSHQYTLAVTEPLTAQISRRVAEVGVPFRAILSATGGQGPYAWSGAGLPTGVTLAAGVVAGTPTAAGSFRGQVTVTDVNGATKTTDVAFVVVRKIAIATRSLPAATAGRAYTVKLAATGGARPFMWSIGGRGLPSGLKLNPRTGVLAGVPARVGAVRLRVRVRDAAGGGSIRALALRVKG